MRYDTTELVERAIRNARPIQIGVDAPRWVAVKYAFGVGSNLARELCRAYGYDPDDIVVGLRSDAYGEERDE